MYRIEKYQEQEIIEYSGQPFDFSQTSLELTTDGEKPLSGEIEIAAQPVGEIHCIFYSDHYRMQCLSSEMTGYRDVLKYRFDGCGLDDGDEVRGEFSLVSNVGEYRIPFLVRIEKTYRNEKFGMIRNLFHFTNLARENFDEAVELFYKKEFELLLGGHDRQYLGLYRGLSGHEMHAQNVETFMIAIHKKQEVTYRVKEEKLILKDVFQNQNDSVTLERSGWGYTHVEVRAEGGFLRVAKELLTEEDFKDNVCTLDFEVDPSKLKQTFQYGRIVFLCGDREAVCDIIIRMPQMIEKRAQGRMDHKKLTAQLMHQYLEYVTAAGDPAAVLKKAEKTIEKINSLYGRNIEGRLYQVHVLTELSRENEARWVLSHVDNMMLKEEVPAAVYAYYLFLSACLEREEDFTQKVLKKLHNLVLSKEGGAAAVCMYLKLLPNDEAGSVKRMSMYEEQYLRGCNSPLLMREAWSVLEESMAYLTKLESFEIALVRFAMRYGLYTREAAAQVNYLVKRKKEMSKALFQMLSMSYELYPDDETIHAMCTLMIRVGMTGKESFYWYEIAVSKNLRITSLYEYYMLSIDKKRQDTLPKIVLMYFAYSCGLPDKVRAYLYANIIRNKTDIPQIFSQYTQQIEEFGWQQLKKGSIDENYAAVYRHLLMREENLEKARPYLLQIAFLHMISVNSALIRRVIVIQDKLVGEQVYPVENGCALVNCYADEYTILLEDGDGNRFCDASLYEDKRLMSVEKIVLFLEQQGEEDLGFLLCQAYLKGDENLSDPENWELYEKLALSGKIDVRWRLQMLDRLLDLYDVRDKTEKLLHLISRYPLAQADQKQRAQVIRYLIGCGQDERAYALLYEYGFEGMSAKALARLLTRTIDPEAPVDAKKLAMAYYTYRQGKYTEVMLTYLCMYFEGDIKKMRDIWRDAVRFDVDATRIAERILLAHMFSGGFISQLEQVFSYYQENGGRDAVLRRYAMRYARDYFVWQQEPQAAVFSYLQKVLSGRGEADDVSKVSYLYYMAQRGEMPTHEQQALISRLAEEFIFQNRYMPFMSAFLPFMPWLSLYTQYTYIEYRTKPGTKVVLHYMVDNKESYETKQMTEIAGGYFCERFLLLFSEKLRYYFVETKDGEENATQSGMVEKSDMTVENNDGRMGMLNDIMISQAMGDEKTRVLLTREYVQTSCLHDILGGDLEWM